MSEKGLSRPPGWGTSRPQRRVREAHSSRALGESNPRTTRPALPSSPAPAQTPATRDAQPTSPEHVWLPARVYWEGQLFSARTPQGVAESECRAPEPLRAIELLRTTVARGLGVPEARVHFAFEGFPAGYTPSEQDRVQGPRRIEEP